MNYEEIPSVLSSILTKLEKIEQVLLSAEDKESSSGTDDRWMGLDELCNYHPDHPTSNTVYAWVRDRKIPHYKTDRKLRFLKSEIDAWLSEGRVRTIDEIDALALRNKRGNRR